MKEKTRPKAIVPTHKIQQEHNYPTPKDRCLACINIDFDKNGCYCMIVGQPMMVVDCPHFVTPSND